MRSNNQTTRDPDFDPFKVTICPLTYMKRASAHSLNWIVVNRLTDSCSIIHCALLSIGSNMLTNWLPAEPNAKSTTSGRRPLKQTNKLEYEHIQNKIGLPFSRRTQTANDLVNSLRTSRLDRFLDCLDALSVCREGRNVLDEGIDGLRTIVLCPIFEH